MSYWSRTDNIFDWIANPTTPNEASLLAVNSNIYLANKLNTLEFCLSLDDAQGGVAVRLRNCDSALGVVSGKPSGWFLAASPTGESSYFAIKSRWDSRRCLGVAGASTATGAVIELQACAASNASDTVKRSQAWKFSTSGTNRTITNRGSGTCMGASTNLLGSTVVLKSSCNSSNADQGWEFYR